MYLAKSPFWSDKIKMCLRSINNQCISFPKDRKITSCMTGTGSVGWLITSIPSHSMQRKLQVSNSPGLVDFAIGLVNSVLSFSAQLASEVFLGIQLTEQLLSKSFFFLVKMTFELVHANYKWQASCKTDFLCTLHHSNNIILFLYFNLHLLKIDFIYLQNDSVVLTFCGHHIQPQLRF